MWGPLKLRTDQLPLPLKPFYGHTPIFDTEGLAFYLLLSYGHFTRSRLLLSQPGIVLTVLLSQRRNVKLKLVK